MCLSESEILGSLEFCSLFLGSLQIQWTGLFLYEQNEILY